MAWKSSTTPIKGVYSSAPTAHSSPGVAILWLAQCLVAIHPSWAPPRSSTLPVPFTAHIGPARPVPASMAIMTATISATPTPPTISPRHQESIHPAPESTPIPAPRRICRCRWSQHHQHAGYDRNRPECSQKSRFHTPSAPGRPSPIHLSVRSSHTPPLARWIITRGTKTPFPPFPTPIFPSARPGHRRRNRTRPIGPISSLFFFKKKKE